jgi:hypothetical protein
MDITTNIHFPNPIQDNDTITYGVITFSRLGYIDTVLPFVYTKKNYQENEIITVVLKPSIPVKLTLELFNKTIALIPLKSLFNSDSLLFDSGIYPNTGDSHDNFIEIKSVSKKSFVLNYYRTITHNFERKKSVPLLIKIKKNTVLFTLDGKELRFRYKAFINGYNYQIQLFRIKEKGTPMPIFAYDTITNYRPKPWYNGSEYLMNGVSITKQEFEHFNGSTFYESLACCPCMFMTKSSNEVIIDEYFGCSGAKIGYHKTYNSNGSLSIQGEYKSLSKQKPTLKIYGKLNYQKDGIWNYYDSLGVKMYSKVWIEGECKSSEPTTRTTVLYISSNALDTIKYHSNISKETLVNADFFVAYNNGLRNNKEKMTIFISSFKEPELKYVFNEIDPNKISSIIGDLDFKKNKTYHISIHFQSDNEDIKFYAFTVVP